MKETKGNKLLTTGGSERSLGPVHGNVATDLDLPGREASVDQRRFERETAADQEPDRVVVVPLGEDVLLLLDEFASLVDAVERCIGADVAIGREVRGDRRVALFCLAEEGARDRVAGAEVPKSSAYLEGRMTRFACT